GGESRGGIDRFGVLGAFQPLTVRARVRRGAPSELHDVLQGLKRLGTCTDAGIRKEANLRPLAPCRELGSKLTRCSTHPLQRHGGWGLGWMAPARAFTPMVAHHRGRIFSASGAAALALAYMRTADTT